MMKTGLALGGRGSRGISRIGAWQDGSLIKRPAALFLNLDLAARAMLLLEQ